MKLGEQKPVEFSVNLREHHIRQYMHALTIFNNSIDYGFLQIFVLSDITS